LDPFPDAAAGHHTDNMDMRSYDYRNCQSLFGYAAQVHVRSGGICALCDYGRRELDFDKWRQLTVEHLIGESQGGHRRDIRADLAAKYPSLSPDQLRDLAVGIDELNTVTACSFCNSTTSRTQAPFSLREVIATGPDEMTSLLSAVREATSAALERKRADVSWKLSAVRAAYEDRVVPGLRNTRSSQNT
jgi:hypothetical protein